ncbi:unannotated protein [freshwater metagenome]|uniref:Unannotated protein n=1 Tax=freshwater metagenome TaxID=449393 RepID=A0A6J6H8Y2_9ZZZZ
MNVHAPVAFGTESVGESDVETQDDGVITEPKYIGVLSPVPAPAGSAARVVGSPTAAAAERSFDDVDEQDEAIKANEIPRERTPMNLRERIAYLQLGSGHG